MIERIRFNVSGPAPNENRLGLEHQEVLLRFGSDQDAFDGFEAFCAKAAAALEGQGLKTGVYEGETVVTGSASVNVDDEGAPGVEKRTVGIGLRTDFSVYETRDRIAKAMEDADFELLN